MYSAGVVFMAANAVVLQNMIDNFHTYCKSWDVTLNTAKSKISVFTRKRRGRISRTEVRNFGGGR